jgi:hypothetical protein
MKKKLILAITCIALFVGQLPIINLPDFEGTDSYSVEITTELPPKKDGN